MELKLNCSKETITGDITLDNNDSGKIIICDTDTAGADIDVIFPVNWVNGNHIMVVNTGSAAYNVNVYTVGIVSTFQGVDVTNAHEAEVSTLVITTGSGLNFVFINCTNNSGDKFWYDRRKKFTLDDQKLKFFVYNNIYFDIEKVLENTVSPTAYDLILTLPAVSDAISGNTEVATLTNKTLVAPTISGDMTTDGNIIKGGNVLTLPGTLAADDTFTMLNEVQTVTNKTFTLCNVSDNLTIGGNLTVTGDLSCAVKVLQNTVEDNSTEYASANTADIIDIGFFGLYQNAGAKYSGLMRDATDGKWKFFTNETVKPTATTTFGQLAELVVERITTSQIIDNNANTFTFNNTGGTDEITANAASQTLTNKSFTAPIITGTADFKNDVEIDGGLTVSGGITLAGGVDLADNSLKLADGHVGDTVDSGFYAQTDTALYSGFIRDATDSKWKLFSSGTEPGTTATFSSFDVLQVDDIEPQGDLILTNAQVLIGANIVTIPNVNGETLVGRATTDTLTNKTLTSPVIAEITNTGVITLPTSTDTLVGRATTDTLINKTLTAPVIATISNTGVLTLPTSTDTIVARDTTDTLTNKTLTAPIFSTISNTGLLTLPTSTDTLVGRDTTDTLTNKTLTSPIFSTISNTGTLTLPTSTDTLVAKNTVDILTNKTLTTPFFNHSIITVNVPTTLTAAQSGSIIYSTAHTGIAITLPVISGNAGLEFYFINEDATPNTVTVTRGGTDTFDNGATTTIAMASQYDKIHIIANGAGIWYTL